MRVATVRRRRRHPIKGDEVWIPKPSDLDALYVPVVPKHQPTQKD
jgi:hypothetical protein